MAIVLDTSSNLQVQQLQTRVSALEQENKQLRQQLSWEDRLFQNPHLSPGHKLALRAAVHTLLKSGRNISDELKKIYIPALAEKIGLSPKTTGKMLQFLATAGALIRETETETDNTGQRITRVSIGLTEAVKHPERIQPPAPRNHGGFREHCPSCGSESLIEEKTIICTDCGSVISRIGKHVNPPLTDGQDDRRNHAANKEGDCEHEHRECQINQTDGQDDRQDEAAPPPPNLSVLKTIKEPVDNLSSGYEKPATPPKPALAILSGQTMKARIHPPYPRQTRLEQEEGERREQTVKLFLDIAGIAGEHIIMPGGSGKKYTTIHRPLTVRDIKEHLAGTKTVGATLSHTDGTTRALCFDTDDNPTDSVTFKQVQEAAVLLVARGYMPLLEPSPAGRGGHMWIIFSERVNARAAYRQVCEIAPALKAIIEYWPGRGNQKVRLPAGKYVTPALTAWTQVQDARGNIITISDLLDQLTPASFVPALVPDEHETDPERTCRHAEEEDHEATAPHRSRTPDGQHRTKYGNHTMWVEWPSEQYLIDRFNSEHTIDELATRERNDLPAARHGMINASQIGREERTASVAVTADGQRFTDFGAAARREDGTWDGGDAFEFYIRSQNLTKSVALRELGRELNRVASAEILRAARAGEVPSSEVMEIITLAGRDVYNENALRFRHKTLEEHERGQGALVGFSDPELRLTWPEQQPQSAEEEKDSKQSAKTEATSEVVESSALCCHAITVLNEHGRGAGAREKVVSFQECGATRWLWSVDEQCYICAVCLTAVREKGN